MSEVKIKGDKIKKGSIPLNALNNEIYKKINNILVFTDEYTIDYDDNYENTNYFLVNSDVDHIDKFKNYIYNLVNYGALGGIEFNFPQDNNYTIYMPFINLAVPRELLLKIYDNDFSDIDAYIECIWGIALNDNNNESYYSVGIMFNPKENKMYIKTIEL